VSPEERIADALRSTIEFSATAIRNRFALEQLPRARGGSFFAELGAFGHVGRADLDLPWERTDQVKGLLQAMR
jgi:S-adenosylmethionine synthetase